MEAVLRTTIAEAINIAATFREQMEARRKEQSGWFTPVENVLEDAFKKAINEAISYTSILTPNGRMDMREIEGFQDYLSKAKAACIRLASSYTTHNKEEEVLQINDFRNIVEIALSAINKLIEEVVNWVPPSQADDTVVGNITFRLGAMQDPEIFAAGNLFVLPISTNGVADKETLSLAKKLKLTKPEKTFSLGEVETISLSSATGRSRAAAWVCCREDNRRSKYDTIRSICQQLLQLSIQHRYRVVNLPLIGVETAGAGSQGIADIYTELLSSSAPKFIVSIRSRDVFLRITDHFIANKKTASVLQGKESPKKPENELESPLPPEPPPPPAKDQPDIKSRLISDSFAVEETDVLQYDVIAENLFAILTDKGTNPPLNIGIFAPWGRGKTSLMRRLQHKFDEAREAELKGQKRTPKKLAGWKALLHWLRSDEIDVKPHLPYATVWFNPWNYQSSDMIWAGMADAVIEQVVGQIPSRTEREVFWMQLRLARLAREKIRKDIQTRLLLYFLQFFTWGVFILLAILFFTLNKAIPWGLIGAGTISGLVTTLASKINPLSTSISESFDKYSEAPKYQEKTGTFHEVQADLNKVLDLCLDEKRPMVIFVDDLDRCSPSKVVEVVEAINVFINGRYNNKCYFILGMDGEMVAGALDVSYEKMKGKLGSRETDQGSIGWYFLDKFIQLPYFIPVMSELKKKEYLRNLLSEKEVAGDGVTGANGEVGAEHTGAGNKGGAPAEAPVTVDNAKVKEVVEKVIATSDNEESSQLIKEAALSPEEQKELDKLILQNQVKSQKQNELIMEQVSAYAPFISSDPRSLKRFANLLRFYCAYQFLRMKKGQRYVEAPILAKWLAIMLKFPQLVRWIQWDSENKSGIHTAAEEKVKLLDDLVEAYCKNSEDQEFTRWLAHELPAACSYNGKTFSISDYPEMPWLRSRKLFDILMNEKAGDSSFRNTLECNVW